MKFLSTIGRITMLALATLAALLPTGAITTASARILQWVFPESDRVGRFSLGANTLTGLIPDLFQSMDIVARELAGMIPSVTMNASAAITRHW